MKPASDRVRAFVVRRLESRDESRVLELLRMTLGEKASTRKTAEYWAWKHKNSPFGRSYAVCAEDPDTGELTGVRPLMRWSYLDEHGTEHAAARAVDTATHPSYQKRGIFSTLTRYAIADLRDAGVEFIFNTPNENSKPAYLKLGWKIAARWPVYVRPVRPLRTALKSIRRVAAPREPPAIEAGGLIPWHRFRDEHADAIQELVVRFERYRKLVGYRTQRTLAYFDWRYGRHPDVQYGVYPTFDAPGRLDGFAIVRLTFGSRGLVAAAVTEVLTSDPSAAGVHGLLRSGMRAVRADYWVAHFSRGTSERSALLRLGFVPVRRSGYTWAALPLTDLRRDPTKATSWDLSLGELEIF